MRTVARNVVGWLGYAIVAFDVVMILTLAVRLGDLPVVNNAIDIWFDRSDPALETLNQERRLFGVDTWMLATVWMKPERVNEAGDASRTLTRDLERVAGVTRVVSPTSIEVLQRDDQGLFFDDLDPHATWPEIRERLDTHPIARDFLVHSKSPESFSVLIRENTRPSGEERQRMVAEVRGVLDGHPALAASALSGVAVIGADLNRLSWRDFRVLLPATIVIASLVFLAMLRFRWRTTLAVLTPVGLGSLTMVAGMLLAGRPFNMVTIALPGIFFTLGIASSLHVTSWFANWLREGHGSAIDAMRATTRQLARPILVSHVTTALGFGLLAVTPVTPVQEMALFGAAGELYSGLHVLFVLPMFLWRFGAMSELADTPNMFAGERWVADKLAALAVVLARLQRTAVRVIVPLVAACVAIAWLISMVKYDSTYLNMIDAAERLRRDYARFDAAGLPSAQLSVVIQRSDDPGIVSAGLNDAIREATADIAALPEVSKVVGPAEIFAEVAPVLAGDEPLARFASDDSTVTDAYIFALSGGNTEIASYVHDGLAAYRLVVFFPYLDNSELEQLAHHKISSILDRHFGPIPDVSAEISGITVLWANMDNAIARGQITSMLIMGVACFATFFVSLLDWRLAATAMFVNVAPVAAVGALFGAIGKPIDMATVFIMGIALGVAVDDTAFFVHEYLDRAHEGFQGLVATLRHTGPTMVATCVVIVIGFSVLLMSSFTPMRTFGGLTALGLVLAMLCDVFITPFLLLAFPGKNYGHS